MEVSKEVAGFSGGGDLVCRLLLAHRVAIVTISGSNSIATATTTYNLLLENNLFSEDST